ncbi:gas vesicle protein [Frankia sp. AgB1.9]|uniref:gas vesicle protein GvpJ n=1 Tax=unclassified Frankia TaxID=2632575 RepID=UPI0019332D4B|nr:MULTISPECIES: gas vesicle protein GvpJ [unclassified Frankia]MBL7494237.1 gas vesicle protein [Frankia sp. AgW1.1]MBL7552456.1 gas vesicle protein [Frankia sp. AgB1.9]MBL7623558.1 gas vesicle protein [Frankia sp. AgB1.8]
MTEQILTSHRPARQRTGARSDTLADVLERVLDKGVVIVGDVVISVLDVELLTLRLRLFIASADTAREMGLDWWLNDPFFSSKAPVRTSEQGQDQLAEENRQLRERLDKLERSLGHQQQPAALAAANSAQGVLEGQVLNEAEPAFSASADDDRSGPPAGRTESRGP